MAQAKAQDNYSNFAIITCTESAANTLTFAKLEASVGLFERVGWLISRVDWYMRGNYDKFNTTGDQFSMALTQSNAISSIAPNATQVILNKQLFRYDYGTAATANFFSEPDSVDLSTLPGGGILVVPNPLYLAVAGSGLSAAAVGTVRIWYKNIVLSDADFFDLMQTRQVLSS